MKKCLFGALGLLISISGLVHAGPMNNLYAICGGFLSILEDQRAEMKEEPLSPIATGIRTADALSAELSGFSDKQQVQKGLGMPNVTGRKVWGSHSPWAAEFPYLLNLKPGVFVLSVDDGMYQENIDKLGASGQKSYGPIAKARKLIMTPSEPTGVLIWCFLESCVPFLGVVTRNTMRFLQASTELRLLFELTH